MARFTNPIPFYNDEKGRSLEKAKLYFYESGTFNVKDTYSDAALTSVNPNPVVADGAGRFPNIFMGTGSYRVILEDEDGVELATKDDVANIIGDGENISSSLYVTTATGTQTVQEMGDDRLWRVDDVSGLEGLTAKAGQKLSLRSRTVGKDYGGGILYYDSTRAKSQHDGITIYSPTVPWTTNAPNYNDAIGETDSGGTGCWVRENIEIVWMEWGGVDGSSTDYLVAQQILNNTGFRHVATRLYNPAGGSCSIDRSNLIVDFNCRTIDFTGVGHPGFIMGQQTDGSTVSVESRINVEFKNVVTSGNKTAGSKFLRYRKASTCRHFNWRAVGLATPFDGDGMLGSYESISCEFYSMDFRGCSTGFNDINGSFQGSTFFGGRIEQNDNEGVNSASMNLNFVGTIIEGNDQSGVGAHNIKVDGGGSLILTNVYGEIPAASTASSFIAVASGSTKRIVILGGDYYGNSGGSRALVAGSNWVTGGLTISGSNLNTFDKYATRGGTAGNWFAQLMPGFSDAALDDPATDLNSAEFIEFSRLVGMRASRLTLTEKMKSERTEIQQSGSASWTRDFQRYIGQVSTGGAGDWHQIIELSDVEAASSTSVYFDLTFSCRQGDFQFNTVIVLTGTSTLGTKEDVSGNWTTHSFRVNAGYLEVDDLPASNRDWNCHIRAIRTTFS